MKRYFVHFTVNKFDEESAETSCRNYPTQEFLSYASCDDNFMRKALEDITPGLVPIWATDEWENVTRNYTLSSHVVNKGKSQIH